MKIIIECTSGEITIEKCDSFTHKSDLDLFVNGVLSASINLAWVRSYRVIL